MRTLLAQDLLEPGTRVLVGRREGNVTASALEDTSSNNGGKVAVHEITFTHYRRKGFGKNYKLEALAKQTTQKINYASIKVLP